MSDQKEITYSLAEIQRTFFPKKSLRELNKQHNCNDIFQIPQEIREEDVRKESNKQK